MKEYDLFFIQNAPAFYKINLFNTLSEHCRVGVVFLGESSQVVMNQKQQHWRFDSYYLNRNLDRTNVIEILSTTRKLWKIIRSVKCKHIIYGGWSNIEFVILMFLIPRNRNCVISESSIYESSTAGIKGLLKRWIINRNSHAFVSGIPHKVLFMKLKYKGIIHMTGGVGLALRNQRERMRNVMNQSSQKLKYIYTGRLIEKKNVYMLIETFNQNGKSLTIIGTGSNEVAYKAKAKSNINFLGFVENSKLPRIYADYDCFILPSNVEQWGLVVEEALYNGLPVIVSDMVGSNVDMVKNYSAGIIFNHKSTESLQEAIKHMEQNYSYYRNNVDLIDWKKRDKEQINQYISIL